MPYLILAAVLGSIVLVGVLAIVLAIVLAAKKKGQRPPDDVPYTVGGPVPQSYAKRRGEAGESAVNELLGKDEDGVRYVFPDYLIAWENGSAEIDHILVEERGVFVIETKTYAGTVYGSEEEREWRCVTRGGNVHTFYNPLMQSRKHAEVIRRILPKAVPVYPLVVFADGDISSLNCPFVFSLPLLKGAIASFPAGKLDRGEIRGVARGIAEAQGGITKEEHAARVQRRTRMIELGVCPLCGCRLERCDGGMRCSSYPKCKFVKKN